MPKCSILGCKRWDCAEERKKGYTFHVFPHKNSDLLQEWILRTCRKDFTPSSRAVVCSAHFNEEDFYTTEQTRRLKSRSVPTLFNVSTPIIQNALEPCQSLSQTDGSSQSASLLPSYQDSSLMINNIDTRSGNHEATDGTNIHTIYEDHTYAIMESPKELKRKLDVCIGHSQVLSKRIKNANQRKRRLQKKVSTLREVINVLKKENLISSDCMAMLESLPALEKEIFKRSVKEVKGKYTDELKVFAATLQFCSNKAYNFVRKSFNLSLPHPSTVRKWYKNVNANPVLYLMVKRKNI